MTSFASTERLTWIYGAIAIALASILFGGKIALSVTIGAVLVVCNAAIIRWVGTRLLRGGATAAGAVGLFSCKLMLLLATIFAVMKFLPILPIPFMLGLSIMPLSIFSAGIFSSVTSSSQKDANG